jgi:hypothetical protein
MMVLHGVTLSCAYLMRSASQVAAFKAACLRLWAASEVALNTPSTPYEAVVPKDPAPCPVNDSNTTSYALMEMYL